MFVVMLPRRLPCRAHLRNKPFQAVAGLKTDVKRSTQMHSGQVYHGVHDKIMPDLVSINMGQPVKSGTDMHIGSFYSGTHDKIEPAAVPWKFQQLAEEVCKVQFEEVCKVQQNAREGDMSSKIAQILRLGAGASVTVDDVRLEWGDLDHSSADSYGRRPIYVSDAVEIMLMSWRPGDVSSIHDHGTAQAGAVKILGPGRVQSRTVQADDVTGMLKTTSLTTHGAGEVLEVRHGAMHAVGMKQPSDHCFSLHVYALSSDTKESQQSVTGGARILDVVTQTTIHTDGGVFHALPADDVYGLTTTPSTADFPTMLRDGSELCARILAMSPESRAKTLSLSAPDIAKVLFAPGRREEFWRDVERIVDPNTGHATDSVQWRIMCDSLREAANVQVATASGSESSQEQRDSWQDYARMYDALIGTPCIDSFMRGYICHFFDQVWCKESGRSVQDCTLLSVGCGTGAVERLMIDEMGVQESNLSCFDFSPSMVEISRNVRGLHQVQVGNALEMGPEEYGVHDVVYAGLNVYQYLPVGTLADAMERAARCTKPGGYFVSDFITTDHMRWYPNLMRSYDRKTASLRSPYVEEEDGRMFMCSDIINITWDTPDQRLKINDSGVHRRWLAPMQRIVDEVRKHYSFVQVLDAQSLEQLPLHADSCPSTRYVIFARK